MKQSSLRALAVLSLALAGCGRQAAPPTATPAMKASSGFDTIRLARTACFGQCPVYEVEIGKDGQGKFVGEAFVKAKGIHEVRLDQRDLALLADIVDRAGFWKLQESYHSEKDGCAEMATDQPSLSISVVSAGKTKTVDFYHGCRGAAVPVDALNWLAGTIDFLAQTRPLVHDPDNFD